MDSFQKPLRQLRIATIIILTIVPLGILGFMLIEQMNLLDATWLTVITLATIGYGDTFARSDLGRVFTMALIITGLGAFAYAAQATLSFFLSPEINDLRYRRRTERHISHLRQHYVICGEGELVTQTMHYLLEQVNARQRYERETALRHIDQRIANIFGGPGTRTTRLLQQLIHWGFNISRRRRTLLDRVVVVTQQAQYVHDMRWQGMLVVEGAPTEDSVLRRAGVPHARALMVMENDDTDALLTVLSARAQNPHLYVTAAALEDHFAPKMLRVGASIVLAPYDVAGQFLNNATFRPAVHDFFNTVVFDHERSDIEVIQLVIQTTSRWCGQVLHSLHLHARFEAVVLAIRRDDGGFLYAPGGEHLLAEGQVLLVIAPPKGIVGLQDECCAGETPTLTLPDWQRVVQRDILLTGRHIHTPETAMQAARTMTSHYIICVGGRVARHAVEKLDPNRSFVIISSDPQQATELLERGFRVIIGSPTHEDVLKSAGISRALALMTDSDEGAKNLLTVITARMLSKKLLIVATADQDEMYPKLLQAGADRVISPTRIAAQFVLMATLRPVIGEFVQHVLFNRRTGLETTELYMEEGTAWVGMTLGALALAERFQAGVVGVQTLNDHWIFVPANDYCIRLHDVLIIVVPMAYSDQLRATAYGDVDKRPSTIRGVARRAPS